MNATEKLIETFLNGNLTDTKQAGKGKSHKTLREGYQNYMKCPEQTAAAFADFIKGEISFQEFCNIELRLKS